MQEPKNPNALLDHLRAIGIGNSDLAIAKKLNITPPVISRIRNGKKGFTAKIILAIYDATDLSIEQIRELARRKD